MQKRLEFVRKESWMIASIGGVEERAAAAKITTEKNNLCPKREAEKAEQFKSSMLTKVFAHGIIKSNTREKKGEEQRKRDEGAVHHRL